MSFLQGFLVWVVAFVVCAFVGAYWIRRTPRDGTSSAKLAFVYVGFPTVVCCAWAIWNNLLVVGVVSVVVLNWGWFIFSNVSSRQKKETASASRARAGGAVPTGQSGPQSQSSLPAVQQAKPTVSVPLPPS